MKGAATPPPASRSPLWVAGGLAIVALLAWLNRVPDGMVFAGGDVVQYFDREFVERNFRHIWAHLAGEGYFSPSFLYYPFYATLFAISDLLGLDPSREALLYMLFLWGGSYLGWLGGRALLGGPGADPWSPEANLLALLYAVNPFTFYAFYFIWGFSPFFFLYALFPVLAAATLRFFTEPSREASLRWLALLFFAHALATIAYANLPFFIAVNLVLAALVGLEWIFERRVSGRRLAARAFAYLAVELAATAWAVLPQLPHLLFEYTPGAADSNPDHWVLWQRLPIWEILTLNPAAGHYLRSTAVLGAFAFAVLGVAIAALAWRRPSQRVGGRMLALAGVVALILLLESKGRGIVPPEGALLAFANPLLGALRSNGKVVIFLPFIALLLLALALSDAPRRARIAVLGAILAACLVSAYPMAAGQLQTGFSVALRSGEGCADAEYCYLNRIPPEYQEAAAAVRRDGAGGKALSLPYSVVNSPGWSNYPSWKHVGVDPTVQLFSVPVVQPNGYHVFGYAYGREWEQAGPDDPAALLALAADLGARYILFHRDASRQFLQPAATLLARYEALGALSRLYDSPVVAVYRVPDAWRRPRIAAQAHSAVVDERVAAQASPTRYVITMPVREGPNELVLREGFSTQWRVHAMPAADGTPAHERAAASRWWDGFFLPAVRVDAHERFARYGNRWRFDGERLCAEHGCARSADGGRVAALMVEYVPQRWVSLLRLLAAVVAVGWAVIIFRFRMTPGSAWAKA